MGTTASLAGLCSVKRMALPPTTWPLIPSVVGKIPQLRSGSVRPSSGRLTSNLDLHGSAREVETRPRMGVGISVVLRPLVFVRVQAEERELDVFSLGIKQLVHRPGKGVVGERFEDLGAAADDHFVVGRGSHIAAGTIPNGDAGLCAKDWRVVPLAMNNTIATANGPRQNFVFIATRD